MAEEQVELHVHLDGAIRHETAWELLKQKKLALPGDGSLQALRDACRVKEPKSLCNFLEPFGTILSPAVIGDLKAIERIALEFVQDRSKDHVAYCEARFSPHLFLFPRGAAVPSGTANGTESCTTVDDVMEAVLRGLQAGEQLCPGTTVRLLLCCMRGFSEWSREVLRLCEKYKQSGVVGIDIAGSRCAQISTHSEGAEIFQEAAEKGIHRTVHAGEDDGSESVRVAVNELKAERIGHGYRVIEDEEVYNMCREQNIHFEVCPYSSYYTGCIKSLLTESKQHPVIRFASDNTSFSISTDDPSITLTSLSDEYELLKSWGFNEALLVRANFNAALCSFLPDDEKQALLQQLKEAYGLQDFVPVKSNKSSPSKPTITVNTWDNRG